MSQAITLTIELPDGFDVKIHRAEEAGPGVAVDPDAVERYFRHYLSDNGRRLFKAAAKVQLTRGPGFTFDDVAAELGEGYSTTLSLHRTTGRSAKRWREDAGVDGPIYLNDLSYDWVAEVDGMRTRYEMPEAIAEVVAGLQ
jgi:hypothetical protein